MSILGPAFANNMSTLTPRIDTWINRRAVRNHVTKYRAVGDGGRALWRGWVGVGHSGATTMEAIPRGPPNGRVCPRSLVATVAHYSIPESYHFLISFSYFFPKFSMAQYLHESVSCLRDKQPHNIQAEL